MIKGILFALLVVFSCLGLSDFIYTVRSAMLRPYRKIQDYCVVFLKPGIAKEQMRYYSHKMRWYGNAFCDKMIGIVDLLGDVEISSLESFCYGGNIYLCRLNNIFSQLNYLETGEFDEG
ncbi:MAG: hypothetical protein J5659_02330 [Clostridia bacterium]|nr:hypothetical protein [Clostridia bacterium]